MHFTKLSQSVKYVADQPAILTFCLFENSDISGKNEISKQSSYKKVTLVKVKYYIVY